MQQNLNKNKWDNILTFIIILLLLVILALLVYNMIQCKTKERYDNTDGDDLERKCPIVLFQINELQYKDYFRNEWYSFVGKHTDGTDDNPNPHNLTEKGLENLKNSLSYIYESDKYHAIYLLLQDCNKDDSNNKKSCNNFAKFLDEKCDKYIADAYCNKTLENLISEIKTDDEYDYKHSICGLV